MEAVEEEDAEAEEEEEGVIETETEIEGVETEDCWSCSKAMSSSSTLTEDSLVLEH